MSSACEMQDKRHVMAMCALRGSRPSRGFDLPQSKHVLKTQLLRSATLHCHCFRPAAAAAAAAANTTDGSGGRRSSDGSGGSGGSGGGEGWHERLVAKQHKVLRVNLLV